MTVFSRLSGFWGSGGPFHRLRVFRRWTIRRKLVLTLLLMLLGFAGIAWAYATLVAVERAAEARSKLETEFILAFERTRAALQEAQVDARQFLADHSDKTLGRFAESIAKAKREAAKLEDIRQTGRQQALTSELRSRVDSFERAVAEVEKTQRAVGMDENSGLHGEIRQAVHALEDVIAGNRELEYWMLEMRRQEKNFIQHGTDVYLDRMDEATAGLMSALAKQEGGTRAKALGPINEYVEKFSQFVDAFKLRRQSSGVFDEEQALLHPLIASAVKLRDEDVAASERQRDADFGRVNRVFILALAGVAVLVTLSLSLLSLGITRSLGRLQSTVRQVTEGDLQARCGLSGGDELSLLGSAFDTMLEERVATLSEVEKERDALNDSVIALMGSVAQLSRKDLTAKAVVAEDVTGPVADAVNLMTSETTKVLSQIRAVSQAVEQAANTVRSQAEQLTQVASEERRLVQTTAKELHQSGMAMTNLARGAKGADEKAGVAMTRTRGALEAVTTTFAGIEKIRDIIRETEKRIKRLGERSQEITGVVNLINTIAERTHILALNASMHAASAGEAGRGFAVVADEVQRLAESSRKATSEIASLVNAIRVETADTVTTMNEVIGQVAEGTRLAQQAGQRMQETEVMTGELVHEVRTIAEGAAKQARDAVELVKRAQTIVKSTERTSEDLKAQAEYTVQLVGFSNSLRESVGVFKLPATAA
jgi:twitching motility protein PilJ